MALTDEQKQRAVEVMKEYLAAPPGQDSSISVGQNAGLDEQRVEVIEGILKPLLKGYLAGDVALEDFKSQIDSTNKRHGFWGFKGIKGQMFFNMVFNVADDEGELDQELKAALAVPANEQVASSRIKTFVSYVNRLREQWLEAGHTGYGCPKLPSVPFFLSYFWQIQERDVWPIYYTNAVNTLGDLNIWKPSGDLAADYLSFKQVQEELAALFYEACGKPFSLYGVEHVFWFKGVHPYKTTPGEADPPDRGTAAKDTTILISPEGVLPESFVPPIIAVLPGLAQNDETLAGAARRSGTKLDNAFEKNVHAAFTILGYETRLLGQGMGRVPDGVAIAADESYGLLWDAKVRAAGYSMGTDDRVIRDYINTQSRELRRRRLLRNMYYAIVSSSFADDFDDAISMLQMETEISEVCLVQAEALVAMVEAKLRAPLEITLGPDGLQRIFCVGGVITADSVREILL